MAKDSVHPQVEVIPNARVLHVLVGLIIFFGALIFGGLTFVYSQNPAAASQIPSYIPSDGRG